MKILLITNGFPPARWAGTETYTANIANGLMDRGHFVQVLCCGDWDEGSQYWNGYVDDTYNDIPVRRLNLNWERSPDPQKYLYNNPVVADYLAQNLEEAKPDLVHVTSCETLSASVLEVVKKSRIPLVLSITDFWFLCPRINLLKSDGENCNGVTSPWDCLRCMLGDSKVYRWPRHVLPEATMETLLTTVSKIPVITRQRGFRGMVGDMADRKRFLRSVFSLPDVRLTASRFVKNIHNQNSFDDSIRIHPYGHNVSWFKHYAEEGDSANVNVGFIGQIINSKGVHVLLDAARRLGNSLEKKVNFLIYGDVNKQPEYRKYLQELADGLDNVRFCGTYPHETSAEVFSKIDILVVPSLWYDFPLIISEAFLAETPVIASNLGGMAEMVSHNLNGLLFERGNVDDLVYQLRQVINEPGLLQRLKNGIPRVKSIGEEVIELENIYLELVRPGVNVHARPLLERSE